jgi:hypothetical protein
MINARHGGTQLKPFRIHVPDERLAELDERLRSTVWADERPAPTNGNTAYPADTCANSPTIGATATAGGSTREEVEDYDRQRNPTLNMTHFLTHMLEPQTIGWALQDSPVGLAAWMLHHPHPKIRRAASCEPRALDADAAGRTLCAHGGT